MYMPMDMPLSMSMAACAQAWKENLLPLLRPHLAKRVDSVSAYLLLYHEAAVANLLEVTLFHAHAAEAIPEDYLLELADWAYRKLLWLNSGGALPYINRKGNVLHRAALGARRARARPPARLPPKHMLTAWGHARPCLPAISVSTSLFVFPPPSLQS